MAKLVATLLFLVLIGAVTLATVLWPEVRRLRKCRRENDELQREHDGLVLGNHERGRRILERWTPRGEPS